MIFLPILHISQKKPYSPGFTLVEVIVVIAITTIILGISIPYYQAFSKNQILKSEAQKLVARLELAQAKARSSDQGESESAEVIGYMLDFSTTASNRTYTLKKHRGVSTFTQVIDSYQLPNEITGISFEVVGGGATTTRVFYYQSPKSFLCCLTTAPTSGAEPVACSTNAFRIVLENSEGALYYIYIEKGGVIYDSNT